MSHDLPHDQRSVIRTGGRPRTTSRAPWDEAARRLAGIRRLIDAITEEVDDLGRLMVQYIHGTPGNPSERIRQPGPARDFRSESYAIETAQEEAEEAAQVRRTGRGQNPPWLRPR